MKRNFLTTTVLLGALGVLTPSLVQAQDRSADPVQLGFWQPVAHYNPQDLVQVRLVNRSGATLLYHVTSDVGESRRLKPGGTVVMTNIRPDSYIVTYSDDTTTQSGSPVKYDIRVNGNAIVNTITRGATIPGDQTMHLHGNGGIFVY